MAPRGAAMKRPAAAPLSGVAKRPAVAQDAAPKPKGSAREAKANQKLCDVVAAALLASSDYPGHVVEMLGASLPGCIGVPKEKRHQFQEEVAGMVGEVLGKSEERLKASLAAEEEKLAAVTGQQAELEAAAKAAADELSAKEEASQAASATAQEAARGVADAQKALTAAETKKVEGTVKFQSTEARKAKLASALKDAYLPLKEGTCESAKEALAQVMSAGKDFGFDPTLLGAFPSAAPKAPADRGNFDNLVIQQLESEFERCTSALEETIAALEPAAKELQAEVEAKAAELEKAKTSEQDCKTALEAAQAAHTEALAAKRAASKALGQCAPELKQAGTELEKAKASLEEFRQGPLDAYKALLERTLLAPEPAAKPEADADMKAAGEAAKEARAEAEAETVPAEAAPAAA